MDPRDHLLKQLAQISHRSAEFVKEIQSDPSEIPFILGSSIPQQAEESLRKALADEMTTAVIVGIAQKAACQAIFSLVVFMDEQRSIVDGECDGTNMLQFAVDGHVVEPPDMSWHEALMEAYWD